MPPGRKASRSKPDRVFRQSLKTKCEQPDTVKTAPRKTGASYRQRRTPERDTIVVKGITMKATLLDDPYGFHISLTPQDKRETYVIDELERIHNVTHQ